MPIRLIKNLRKSGSNSIRLRSIIRYLKYWCKIRTDEYSSGNSGFLREVVFSGIKITECFNNRWNARLLDYMIAMICI